MIKQWIPEKYVEKICFVDTKSIRQYVEEDQLPLALGGTVRCILIRLSSTYISHFIILLLFADGESFETGSLVSNFFKHLFSIQLLER